MNRDDHFDKTNPLIQSGENSDEDSGANIDQWSQEEIVLNKDEPTDAAGVHKTLSIPEVRAEIKQWIEPMQTEVSSLVEKNAITRLSPEQAKDWVKDHPRSQVYPSKAVCVLKRGKEKSLISGVWQLCGKRQQ